MSDSVSFKYILAEDDYVRAVRAFTWLQLSWRIMLAVFGLAAAALVGLAIAGVGRWSAPWFIGIVATCTGLGVSWWLWTWLPRSHARKSPSVGKEIAVTASPEGMSSRSVMGSSDARWSLYTAARETTEFFLLSSGKALFYPFPKSAFADPLEIDQFRELLRAHVADVRLLDRAQTR